jgi:transposase
MTAPRKYPEELRDRAIRMVIDLRRDLPRERVLYVGSGSSSGSIPRRCATEVQQVEIDEGSSSGATNTTGSHALVLPTWRDLSRFCGLSHKRATYLA